MTSELPIPSSPQVGIACASQSQRVQPGEQAVYFVTVENRSSEAQSMVVSVRGLPDGWCKLDFDTRERMFPRDQRNATLVVAVPAGAPVQQQPFQIIAQAGAFESGVGCVLDVLAGEASPAKGGDADAPLRSAPGRRPISPGVMLSPPVAAWDPVSGLEAKLMVTIRNVDSGETDYNVAVEDLAATWFTAPPALRIPGGESGEAVVRLHPPATTRPGDFAFRIRVSIEGAPDVVTEARAQLSVSSQPKREPPPPSPAASAESPAPAAPDQIVIPPVVTILPASIPFIRGQFNGRTIVKVQNKSTLLERYMLSLDGLPDDWYTFVTRELTLEPGKSQEIPLTITPRPRAGFPPGTYRFRVRAAPHRFPDSFDEAGGEITMETDPPKLTALLEPAQGEGRKEKFKLTLTNVGNVATNVWMEGSDPEGACKFKFPPSPNLQPGDQAVIPVWVGARRNGLLGQPETFDFHMRVSPAGGMQQDIQSFNARLIHHPFLGFRFAGISLFIAALIAIVGIVISLGPSKVSDASTWVGCRFDNQYQLVKGGKVYVKQDCGGAAACIQHPDEASYQAGLSCPSAPAAAAAAPTPTVSAAPTLACASEVGVAVNGKIIALHDTRIRSAPTTDGDNILIPGLPSDLPATVVEGPKCANDKVWWKIHATDVDGWAAEKQGDQPLLQPSP